MNTVERKRLAIINNRLRSSDLWLRFDAKNLNELKELKQRRHHEVQLEICSVETERIKNTTNRTEKSSKAPERLGVRNRPRAVQLRSRRVISKPENDMDSINREVSNFNTKGNDPALKVATDSINRKVSSVKVNDSIPKRGKKGTAALWSKDKISSISLAELSKRPEEELSRKAANRIRAPGTDPFLPSACEKSVQSLDAATLRSRMRPRAISSRRKFSGTSIGLTEISSGNLQELRQLSSSEISSSRSVFATPAERSASEKSFDRKNLTDNTPQTDSSISNLVSTLRSLLHEVQDNNKSRESFTVCCTILEQLEKSHSDEVSSLSHQIEKWQKLYVEELVSNNMTPIKKPTGKQEESEKFHKNPKDKSLENSKSAIAQSA